MKHPTSYKVIPAKRGSERLESELGSHLPLPISLFQTKSSQMSAYYPESLELHPITILFFSSLPYIFSNPLFLSSFCSLAGRPLPNMLGQGFPIKMEQVIVAKGRPVTTHQTIPLRRNMGRTCFDGSSIHAFRYGMCSDVIPMARNEGSWTFFLPTCCT